VDSLQSVSRVFGVIASLLTAVLVGYAALLLWNTEVHSARVVAVWLPVSVLGLAVGCTELWRLRRANQRVTLPLLVAQVLLGLAGLATVLAILLGGLAGAVVGLVIGVPVTLTTWFIRHRIIGRHVDGPLGLVILLLVGAASALQRPWTPHSGQWSVLAVVALFAALLVAVSSAVAFRPEGLAGPRSQEGDDGAGPPSARQG
jgi:hypothetical protein